MIPIDSTHVGVETEGELRMAVGNNSYSYIYLVNNITMAAAITIYAGQTTLVIDGEWPRESGIFHTFTDMNSASAISTIGIRATSGITITLRNMVIEGRNYYGVPYIVENIPPFTDTSNVSVLYENVIYNGPQITYNRYGFTRYTDCTITIKQTGTAVTEEVGEVNRVEIGGRTSIYHTGEDDAVFWFNNTTATSSLTVLAGAEVDIYSESSYFMYNRNPLSVLAPVTYTLQAGARLRLQTYKGIAYSDSHPVRSFLVGENASFHYIQTAPNDSAATLYIDGALEVRQGARFYMQAAEGPQPLILFTDSAAPSLSVNNAKSFVLYSPTAPALSAQNPTSFTLNGGQLNTWSIAKTPVEAAGGFDDESQLRWFKRDYAQPIAFGGTFTETSTTATGNMEPVDEPHPADSDLQLQSAWVISLGDWPFLADPVENDGRPITGQTEPGANLIAEYEIAGIPHKVHGAAGTDGSFAIDTSSEEPPAIPAGTEVAIGSNIPFLIKSITTVAVAAELLIESAPDQIVFRPRPIAFGPPLLSRVNPQEPVVVRDSRAGGAQWELLASVTGPLKTVNGEVLTDAVVFVETEGETPITLGETPQVVFTGGPGVVTTDVFWPEKAGILVRVTGPVRSGVAYTTQIVWDLRPI